MGGVFIYPKTVLFMVTALGIIFYEVFDPDLFSIDVTIPLKNGLEPGNDIINI